MFDIGMPELLVIAVVAILVLGPDKLPEAMKQIARLINKTKRMWNDATKDIRQEIELEEMKEEMKKYKDELNKIQNSLPHEKLNKDMSDLLK